MQTQIILTKKESVEKLIKLKKHLELGTEQRMFRQHRIEAIKHLENLIELISICDIGQIRFFSSISEKAKAESIYNTLDLYFPQSMLYWQYFIS